MRQATLPPHATLWRTCGGKGLSGTVRCPRVSERALQDLVRRSKEEAKQLATLSIDTEVRFRSPAERAAFSNELTNAITKLVARYHDESAPGGRAQRLVVVAHPLPGIPRGKEPSCP